MHPVREAAPDLVSGPGAFLNIPYDDKFQDLFLAYIAGVSAFGLVPRAALEIPGGQPRLSRILGLIKACPYSFHDLSCVTLDPRPPRTPRFNMPFELGLAVAYSEWVQPEHTWFTFEAKKWRLQKSLSDLGGTDPYIHDGTPEGIFRQLCNALTRHVKPPSLDEMEAIRQSLLEAVPVIRRTTGAKSLFEARVFWDVVVIARKASVELIDRQP